MANKKSATAPCSFSSFGTPPVAGSLSWTCHDITNTCNHSKYYQLQNGYPAWTAGLLDLLQSKVESRKCKDEHSKREREEERDHDLFWTSGSMERAIELVILRVREHFHFNFVPNVYPHKMDGSKHAQPCNRDPVWPWANPPAPAKLTAGHKLRRASRCPRSLKKESGRFWYATGWVDSPCTSFVMSQKFWPHTGQ